MILRAGRNGGGVTYKDVVSQKLREKHKRKMMEAFIDVTGFSADARHFLFVIISKPNLKTTQLFVQ
jgi:hypothetical protein